MGERKKAENYWVLADHSASNIGAATTETTTTAAAEAMASNRHQRDNFVIIINSEPQGRQARTRGRSQQLLFFPSMMSDSFVDRATERAPAPALSAAAGASHGGQKYSTTT